MGEIESAIGVKQLQKLNYIIKKNQLVAETLNKGLSNLKGLQIPKVRKGSTHVYYVFVLSLFKNEIYYLAKIDYLNFSKVMVSITLKFKFHLLPILKNKNVFCEFSSQKVFYKKYNDEL